MPVPTHRSASVDTFDAVDDEAVGPKDSVSFGLMIVSGISIRTSTCRSGSGPSGPVVIRVDLDSAPAVWSCAEVFVSVTAVSNDPAAVTVAERKVPSAGSNFGRFDEKFTSVVDRGWVTQAGVVVAACDTPPPKARPTATPTSAIEPPQRARTKPPRPITDIYSRQRECQRAVSTLSNSDV